MIQAARALREQGIVPPGVDNPEVYRQRSGEVVLPRNADWFEATKELRARCTPRPKCSGTGWPLRREPHLAPLHSRRRGPFAQQVILGREG